MSVPTRVRGFTLIELMIAVAIVGILTAIAYPMYLDKVRASRRVDAKSSLLQAANAEEQYYTTEHTYSATLGDLGVSSTSENGFYKISASVSGTSNQQFLITASAQGDQVNDTCVTYTINQIGAKKASDGSGNDVSGTCW